MISNHSGITSKRLISEILSCLTIDASKHNNTNENQHVGTENDQIAGLPFYAQPSASETDVTTTDASSFTQDTVFFNATPIFATSDEPSSEFGLPGIHSIQNLKKKFIYILENQYLSCSSNCSRKYNQLGFDVGKRGRVSCSDIGVLLGMEESESKIFCDLICTDLQSSGDGGRDTVCRVYNPYRRDNEYALKHMLQSNLAELINFHIGGIQKSTNILVEIKDDLTESGIDELWCPSLEDLSQQVGHMGIVTSAQLAQELELTRDDVEYLLNQLNESTMKNAIFVSQALTKGSGLDNDSMKVNHQHKREHIEERVINALSGVTLPTMIDSLFPNENNSILIPIVEALCKNGFLHGSLSTYKSSTATSNASYAKNHVNTTRNAIFTPHIYTYTQRNCVDSLFQTNGFLTEKMWISLGLSRNRIEAFVKETFPGAVLLQKCIVEPNQIFSPLVESVQSAISNKSFVDLRSLLPDDIASNCDDVREIIHQHIGDLLAAQQSLLGDFYRGRILIDDDLGLFFSHDMTEQSKKLLVLLAQEFGKQRANEIVKVASHTSSSTGTLKCGELYNTSNLIPLLDVADSIATQYPDLMVKQQQFEEMNGRFITTNRTNSNLKWEAADNGHSVGPLIAFCRTLFSNELRSSCMRIISAEVSRLNDTKRGISVSARTAGATEIKDMEVAFERSFKDMCYLLQVLQKSLETLIQRCTGAARTLDFDEKPLTNKLREELLVGCGSVLATKILQYAAFKNGVDIDGEECILSFSCNEKGFPEKSHPVPKFFDAVDMSTLTFPTISLSCRPDKNGKYRDPLKYLQTMFPGNLGIVLANTWRLCTDIDTSRNCCGDSLNEKDNLEEFLFHLKENCLLSVGIPFPILDKKSEKRILAERRQALLSKLESSENNEVIWMAAAVLIYQQVRNVTVAGEFSIRIVLNQLEKETKISHTVGETIKKLSESPSSTELSLRRKVSLMGSAKNSKALATIASELSTLELNSEYQTKDLQSRS